MYHASMPRWEPDAQSRIEAAALDLFAENGYDRTTIADIAQRAGLMKRSFFRYFPDKRDVLFAGTEALATHFRERVEEAPPTSRPWHALMHALATSERLFPRDRSRPRIRRTVIAHSSELREREVLKILQLERALVELLGERGLRTPHARYVVGLAMLVYEQAFDRWLDAEPQMSFWECMSEAGADLTQALGLGGVTDETARES